MPRRSQLAFALILVLGLALLPLGDLACGIACMAATPHSPIRSAATARDCVHAASCCHSSSPAICSATRIPDADAALLASDTTVSHDSSVLAVIAAVAPSQSRPDHPGHSIAGSPPGPATAAASPLRI